MEVKISQNNESLIMEFVGRLDTGTAPKVEVEVNKQLEKHNKVIIDLKETAFVSSAGLRIFLATAKKLMKSGGKLRICNPNDVVNEVFQISGFNTILDVKGTLEEALEGF